MKTQFKYLAIIVLALATQLKASDKPHTFLRCHTPNISDGGYNIQIVSGGIEPSLRALISENTFFGGRDLGVVTVKSHQINSNIEFVDINSRGHLFTLNYDLNAITGENSYQGHFHYVQAGQTHRSYLQCTPSTDLE